MGKRVERRLTVKRVKRIKDKGRYPDGNCLYLQVSETGVRSWIFRYQRGGKETSIGLGALHTVSLDEARELAKRSRQQLKDGIDPLAAKNATRATAKAAKDKTLTFSQATQQYFDLHQKKWSNAKHAAQFIGSLKAYADPVIGAMPVADIGTPDVLRVLEQKVAAERGYPAGPFWNVRTETASRVRGKIENVLDWAAVRGYRRGDNPARWTGNLKHALPARSEVAQVEHHKALPYAELPAFMAELRKREALAARALELLIMTAARTGEVIGATWDEIDLDNGAWTIPAGRMKAGKEHIVPLSPHAIELLRGLYRERDNDYVFIGSQRGAGLSNMAMAAVLQRMGHDDITVHGFRSSFRDWAGDRSSFDTQTIEFALAHGINDKTEAAYRRSTAVEKRRRLMQAWATYCATPPAAKQKGGKVVPMRGAR